MNAIAIIPARGGSKGVPRKNVRTFAGTPLIGHSIRAALDSGVFSAVVVSSEDAEILEVARAEGATVVIRPAELATDGSLTEPVMAHAIETVEAETGEHFDSVWLLQPTSPLRTADDIRRAAELLGETGIDAVVSVSEDHSFYWDSDAERAGVIKPEYDLAARPRRQDLAPRWRENGAIYAVSRDMWERSGVRAAGTIARCEMPADRSLEIDTLADWRLTEMVALLSGGASGVYARLRGCRAVAFDFDGVMTDNTVVVSQDGSESVICSRSDGWGIASLRKLGVAMTVISTEENPVVAARCAKLGIECVQGVSDKVVALTGWLARVGVDANECAFVGNDENDLGCLEMAGVAVVPSDAHEIARRAADVVLGTPGGRGAVRELCDIMTGSH